MISLSSFLYLLALSMRFTDTSNYYIQQVQCISTEISTIEERVNSVDLIGNADLFVTSLGVNSKVVHYQIYRDSIVRLEYSLDGTLVSPAVCLHHHIEDTGLSDTAAFCFQIINTESNSHLYFKEISYFNNAAFQSRILFDNVPCSDSLLPEFNETRSILKLVKELESIFR